MRRARVDAPDGERLRELERRHDPSRPAEDGEEPPRLATGRGHLIHDAARGARAHALGALREEHEALDRLVPSEGRRHRAERGHSDGRGRADTFALGHRRGDEDADPGGAGAVLSQE